MRADRLLSILLLLQVHARLTARELAARLEVSARTIHRDMEALSAAGVPVLAERGTRGGWMLMEGYRTSLTGLNPAETQALFVGQPARLLADLGLDRASDAALIKLLAALPAVRRREAEYVQERIYVDAAGWRRYEEPVPLLPAIQAALWADRRLRMTYRTGDGGVVEREVDPLGLVAKGAVWYVVAAVSGEPRSYRASRIQDAAVLDEASTRPEGFRLAAYWQQQVAEFTAGLPRYPAVLRVAPDVLPRIRALWRYARVERESEPEADGWLRLEVLFEVGDEAAEYVLGQGPRIEVLEPAELRARVRELAAQTVARYAGPSGGL